MHTVKITEISRVTHDVKRFRAEKPTGYKFTPGQATDVSLNKNGWEEKKRPFTFTCLPDDDFLEFIIKQYTSHNGVTREIHKALLGDELIIEEPFGNIQFKGAGLFVAGGAGITPFISIFRKLQREDKIEGNTLIYGNKTRKDIILHDELKEYLGNNFINILSDDDSKDYQTGFISREDLTKNLDSARQFVYVCGPPPMMDLMMKYLSSIDVRQDMIVKESD